MYSNDEIIDLVIAKVNQILDNKYQCVAEDINKDAENTIGVYVRSAGAPVMVGTQIGFYDLDITLRVHGKKPSNGGGKAELSEDVAKLESGLIITNKVINGIKVMSMRLRGKGQSLGVTSENIPVFNVSYIIKLQ